MFIFNQEIWVKLWSQSRKGAEKTQFRRCPTKEKSELFTVAYVERAV